LGLPTQFTRSSFLFAVATTSRNVREGTKSTAKRHKSLMGVPTAWRWTPRYAPGVIEVAPERFEEFVAEAIDAIPQRFADEVDNVAFLVEDDSDRGNLLGLYEGIPLTKRWHYSGAMPDRITIYRLPICRMCRSEDEVRAQVHATVVHELGHYFGINDARLDELGW